MRHSCGISRKSNQLLVSHLGYLVHLTVSISGDKLFDDHESTTHSNNQLTVQDLSVNLLGSEQIKSISDLSDWNRAVRLVDVVAQHLIENITLWHVEHRFLLLVTDLLVHDLDDLVLVLDKQLHLLDVIDLLGHVLRKVIESFDQQLLVLSQSLDISLVSLDVPVQVSNLGSLELNLLVQISPLLPNDVQLLDLVLDDSLSLLKG